MRLWPLDSIRTLAAFKLATRPRNLLYFAGIVVVARTMTTQVAKQPRGDVWFVSHGASCLIDNIQSSGLIAISTGVSKLLVWIDK